MKTYLSLHAYQRVRDRLTLQPAELRELLDNDLAINIGIEKGHLEHRLFYSIPDGVCYVAVQDMNDKCVITILPVDYHERIAWSVSTDAQKIARDLISPSPSLPSTRENDIATGEVLQSPSIVNHAQEDADSGPKVFKVSAYYYDEQFNLRIVNLGSWPSKPYEMKVERLLGDEAFLKSIRDMAQAKGVEIERTEAIYVRLGTRGTPVRVTPFHIDEGHD